MTNIIFDIFFCRNNFYACSYGGGGRLSLFLRSIFISDFGIRYGLCSVPSLRSQSSTEKFEKKIENKQTETLRWTFGSDMNLQKHKKRVSVAVINTPKNVAPTISEPRVDIAIG